MADVCKLTGNLIALDGSPLKFAGLSAYLRATPDSAGVLLPSEIAPGNQRVTAYTDKEGSFSLSLLSGLCYEVELPGGRGSYPLLVPSTDTAVLTDILFPRIVSIEWSSVTVDEDGELIYQDLIYEEAPTRIELDVEQSIYIALRVTLSDGRESAFRVEHIAVDPDDLDHDVLEEAGIEISLDDPGDVTLSTVDISDPYNAMSSDSPIIQHPASNYLITLPQDLLIRFV